MTTCPLELRERVTEVLDAGQTCAATAARFQVRVALVGKLLKQRRETGSIEPRRGWAGSPPALNEGAVGRLRQAVLADPGATLDELRRRARLACSRPTVYRYLKRLGFTAVSSSAQLSTRRASAHLPRTDIAPPSVGNTDPGAILATTAVDGDGIRSLRGLPLAWNGPGHERSVEP